MKTIFSFLFIFSTFLFSKDIIKDKVYTFGVVPQQSPQKMFSIWKPIVEELKKTTGLNIVLKIEKSIPIFEKKLYSGQYDIAYSNPYHFVIANKYQGHQAVLRFNKEIQGILVTNTNSSITNIEELNNDNSFLFPAPKAFAATILTKYELLNKKNINVEKNKNFKYVNSHDSVYLGVLRNVGDVGAGIMRTFNNFKDKDKLRIVYKTNKYPSHPISITNKIDKKIKTKIELGFISLSLKVLKKVQPKSLKITTSEEYNIVRDLAKELHIFRP